MKIMTKKIWSAVAGIALAASAAGAEDSAYRHAQTADSLAAALDGRSVALLKAKGPKGGWKKRLLAVVEFLPGAMGETRFESLGTLAVTMRDSNSVIAESANGAYLEIDRDASSFRFHVGPTAAREVASSEQMSLSDIEMHGRAALNGGLYGLVIDGADTMTTDEIDNTTKSWSDRVVFLGSRYVIEDVGNIESGGVEETVLANIAIFGREIDGVPVVGPGSKAALFLGSGGELIGFDIDWPVYKLLRKAQATVSIDAVASRFAEVAERPVPLPGTNVEEAVALARFECGYVDLGARKRKGQKIQAGCAAQVEGRSADGTFRVAYSEFMPIGDPVQRDRNWPAAQQVRQDATRPCRPRDPSCEIPTKPVAGAAPFYVTTMTHMEGNSTDHVGNDPKAVFDRHAALLRHGASVAAQYGAILTIESEIPFSVGQLIHGDNVLDDMLAYGHGVGTHCDIRPLSTAPETTDYRAVAQELTGETIPANAFDINFAGDIPIGTLRGLAADAELAATNAITGLLNEATAVDYFAAELANYYKVNWQAAWGLSAPGDLTADNTRVLDVATEWRIRKVLVDMLVGEDENFGCSGGGGVPDWVQGAELGGFAYVDGVVGFHYLSMPLTERPYGWDDATILGETYHDAAPVLLEDRVHPVFLKNAADFQEDTLVPEGAILMNAGSIGRVDSFDGLPEVFTEDDIDGAMAALAEAVGAHDGERIGKAVFYMPATIFQSTNTKLLEEFFYRINEEFVDTGLVAWASQKDVYEATTRWNVSMR
jgi:hypothetical protein